MNVVALTGAGISKAAGIPTFQEVQGLKEKLTQSYKDNHPKEFQEAYDDLIQNVTDKEPTKAHYALASYQVPIITMNVDCLHQRAGSKKVIELHGNHIDNNIILYDQPINNKQESVNQIIEIAQEAQRKKEDSTLLVVGTSLQTGFANTLVGLAKACGMRIRVINKNAEEEVPKFLEEQKDKSKLNVTV